MASGRINLQANDGKVAGVVFEDGASSNVTVTIPKEGGVLATQSGVDTAMSTINASVPAAYHIYNGQLSLSNTVTTAGFSTTLYTGNGTSQSITTGVDMDTQWGNDASEKFGGLVWGKSRSGNSAHCLLDTIRGVSSTVFSNLTNANDTTANRLTAFSSSGFSVGTHGDLNTNTSTYASWNFQTTHRVSGTTNHGKPYTCHYNPFTGFTMVKYEGSGIAGHEIPHHLGRKLGFWQTKNLTDGTAQWNGSYFSSSRSLDTFIDAGSESNNTLTINSTSAQSAYGMDKQTNALSIQYILYGWANSYFDESNKLIGNYEIGVYQGTGASGNKVTTRGKPAWVMIKRLDSTGNWWIVDNQRSSFDGVLYTMSANAEDTNDYLDVSVDGFTLKGTGTSENASGGQYLYMVVYDNDSGSGKSKYPKATDTTNLSINALVPYANGIDVNGSKVSIEYKNETITGLTLTQGKNYVYSKNDGTYGVSKYAPCYGLVPTRTKAGETPDFFDIAKNKWYTTTGGAELVTNGTFDSNTNGWTANFSATLSIYNSTLKVLNSGAYESAYQLLQLTVGKTYTIKMSVAIGDCTSVGFVIRNDTPTGGVAVDTTTGIGTITKTFTAQSQNTYIMLRVEGAAGKYGYFDNISVFEAVPTIGTEITTSRNYLNHIVYADNDGSPLYVEELPKIEYKDIVKANEFKGKNACTAWVNFDGTTTPPTIRDSYNVSAVVRTTTGVFDLYFKYPMDNINYSFSGQGFQTADIDANGVVLVGRNSVLPNGIYKTTVQFGIAGGASYAPTFANPNQASIQIFGGKN